MNAPHSTQILALPRAAMAPVVPSTSGDPAGNHGRERPSVRDVVVRVFRSLLIACAIPATTFYLCLVTFNVWVAISGALSWTYGAIIWRKLTRRRASGLLILTAVVMTGRTAITVSTNNTFWYFLQPIISDGLIAATFLLSLATARPVVARLAGDFYPMDHELSMRPRIRRLFWYLTLMWALLCLGKASFTFWLLHSQSLETFVLVKSISMVSLNALAVVVTIWAGAMVAGKEGLLSAGQHGGATVPA